MGVAETVDKRSRRTLGNVTKTDLLDQLLTLSYYKAEYDKVLNEVYRRHDISYHEIAAITGMTKDAARMAQKRTRQS